MTRSRQLAHVGVVARSLATVIVLFGSTLMALQAHAQSSDVCFEDPRVKALIEQSREIDECFASDQNRCLLDKMTVDEQRGLNAQRLIPFNRSKNSLFDDAVGVVTADIAVATGSRSRAGNHAGTGQRISRCHVLTSAHLFYSEISERVSSLELPLPEASAHLNIRFHWGQTCNADLTRNVANADIVFRMTREKQDFVCDEQDNEGRCLKRRFFGRSDAVILKLKDEARRSRPYFKVNTSPVNILATGSRVSCWGFPEYNNQIKLPQHLSDQVLWHQLNAKVFPGRYDRGMLTNAIAYPGMSGGGCALASAPNELVAIYTAGNSATGHAAILASAETADARSLNFLTPMDHLAARYRAATGKRIEDLDKECD